MGRKAKGENTPETQAMDVLAQKERLNDLSVAEIDNTYLPEGESYNLHVVIERARFYQEQAASSLIELGKQILLLRAHEPHGQFLTALEELGMAERSARYAMAAAQKFSNRHTCADLGNAKIRALTVLDDDSIKTLEDGGEIAGIGTLDDVERMTVKELKTALREEKKKRKEEREAQEAAISQKEKKLNELEQELRYRQPPTKEDIAQAKLDELKKKFYLQVGEVIFALNRLIETISQAEAIPDVSITQLQGFVMLEPEELLGSIFRDAETLDDMIENICPDRTEENFEERQSVEV